MWRFACVFLIASCSSGGDGRPGAKQCERLREHLIDNQLAAATGVDKAAHREALRTALGTEFITRCTQAMTDDQVDCALKANDDTTLHSCTR